MTLGAVDLALYALAMFVLFITPGPVWLGLMARAMSGGFQAAWPLALGVVVGDILWPFIAILGVTWIVSVFDGFMVVMRIVATLMFIGMGALLIRGAGRRINPDSRLTRPGKWAGFMAGLAIILSNPKAVLFYMGVLPGFFDLSRMTGLDMAAVVFISFSVPLMGNLLLALFIDRIRGSITSPGAVKRTNIISGALLILVGLIIPFT